MELQDLFKKAREIGLTDQERSAMKHMLVSKIEDSRRTSQGTFRGLSLKWRIKPMPVFLIIALLIAGGAGTSLAAQKALPGSPLWTIKVNVNEKVESALAIGAKADGDVAEAQAEARLDEAEKLAAHNDLKADVLAQLKANFAAHADRVKARIADLEAKGDTDKAANLAAHFETSLKVHDAILARLSGDAGLKAKVETEAAENAEVRAKAEARVRADTDAGKVKAAAEGRITAAENKINEVSGFIAKKSVNLSAEAKAAADAKLTVAKNQLVDAKAKLAAGKFADAFMMAGKAHATTQEAQIMANASVELKVDIKGEVKDSDDQHEKNAEIKTEAEEHGESTIHLPGKIELKLK